MNMVRNLKKSFEEKKILKLFLKMSFDSSVILYTFQIDNSIPQRLLCYCEKVFEVRGDIGLKFKRNERRSKIFKRIFL